MPISASSQDPPAGAAPESSHPGLKPWVLICWVAVAGAVGALLRFALVLISNEEFMMFPWATFAINATGSFGLGILYGFTRAIPRTSDWAFPVIGVGLLGSFTTFSSVMAAAVSTGDRALFELLKSPEVATPGLWEMGIYLGISALFCTAAAAAGIITVFTALGYQRPLGGSMASSAPSTLPAEESSTPVPTENTPVDGFYSQTDVKTQREDS